MSVSSTPVYSDRRIMYCALKTSSTVLSSRSHVSSLPIDRSRTPLRILVVAASGLERTSQTPLSGLNTDLTCIARRSIHVSLGAKSDQPLCRTTRTARITACATAAAGAIASLWEKLELRPNLVHLYLRCIHCPRRRFSADVVFSSQLLFQPPNVVAIAPTRGCACKVLVLPLQYCDLFVLCCRRRRRRRRRRRWCF